MFIVLTVVAIVISTVYSIYIHLILIDLIVEKCIEYDDDQTKIFNKTVTKNDNQTKLVIITVTKNDN